MQRFQDKTTGLIYGVKNDTLIPFYEGSERFIKLDGPEITTVEEPKVVKKPAQKKTTAKAK